MFCSDTYLYCGPTIELFDLTVRKAATVQESRYADSAQSSGSNSGACVNQLASGSINTCSAFSSGSISHHEQILLSFLAPIPHIKR